MTFSFSTFLGLEYDQTYPIPVCGIQLIATAAVRPLALLQTFDFGSKRRFFRLPLFGRLFWSRTIRFRCAVRRTGGRGVAIYCRHRAVTISNPSRPGAWYEYCERAYRKASSILRWALCFACTCLAPSAPSRCAVPTRVPTVSI